MDSDAAVARPALSNFELWRGYYAAIVFGDAVVADLTLDELRPRGPVRVSDISLLGDDAIDRLLVRLDWDDGWEGGARYALISEVTRRDWMRHREQTALNVPWQREGF